MVETSHTAIPTRDEIAIEDTWDLSTIFPSDEAWESEYETVRPAIDRAAAFRGRLAEGTPVVKEAIDAVFALQLSINRLAVYASLRKDENTTDTEAISRYERAIFASIQAGEALAFLEPELLALSAETLGSYAAADELSSYRFMLQDLERRRPHVRSEEVEEVLAQLADVSRASSDAFGALDNADISFGEIEDEDGNIISLSKARYGKLIESPNRDVRQRAFKAMAAPYLAHANTLASLHGSSVRKDVASARVRGHKSALEEALFGDNLPESVYHGLIDVVRENTPLLERSLALRKRALGLDKLERFDLRVPLSKEPRRVYDYREAVDVVLAGVSELGERYTNDLRTGFNSRWVDVHETQNKRSGAYSWGVYGSPPVMLMNWNGTISDVYTLAHEAGHAMHTYYANESQEFHNAGYPIFLAEIASTVNEVLLTWHLLGTEEGADPQTRFSLLNRFVEGFEGTIANQTMYADFELRTHTAAEEGRPLTREYLTEQFGDVQATYAPGVGVNEESAIHWARVPHFYRAFYVFKYATGLAAAISIARAVRDEGEPARERYLEMLAAGGSDYPLPLLQNAGVDLSTPEPIRVAFEEYELVLAEMERLADEGVLDDGSGER
jgi:oligoendopeptidase F